MYAFVFENYNTIQKGIFLLNFVKAQLLNLIKYHMYQSFNPVEPLYKNLISLIPISHLILQNTDLGIIHETMMIHPNANN